ncbi:MAG: hypothetical protein OXK78_05495 [Caldilineaceae bacterium]|nr:hypothetical protein [Caldilineaceae bacterium]
MTAELTGYTDKLSVAPGEPIRFMVSTDLPSYSSNLVRLIHGDQNPAGPGFKEELEETEIDRRRTGRRQIARAGSFVFVTDDELLSELISFTLQAWIWPTTPEIGERQGLLSKWSDDMGGFSLAIGEEGALELRLGEGGATSSFSTGCTMRAREWYFVAASFDSVTRRLGLFQWPSANWPADSSCVALEETLQAPISCRNHQPLLMAATSLETEPSGNRAAQGLFNGKIDSPRLFSRALTPTEIQLLKRDHTPEEVAGADLVASWDFSKDQSSAKVTDSSPNRLHGTAVNMPTRAVTGRNWTSTEADHKHAPNEYAAIHFHQDDLENAGWQPDFELTVPVGLRSGIYAARLDGEGLEDHVPFIVRPARDATKGPILFLVPTFTYLAYANDRMDAAHALFADLPDGEVDLDQLDIYLAEHPEFAMSLYDRHSDGSGCCYSSSLRPLVNMRPRYRHVLTGGPRNLGADLYLIDWLEHKNYTYDVAADEDLHKDGLDLLARYRVVVTGTHPEYWTTQMLAALEDFLAQGGRLAYLGGNGFYWVTSVDPERPHVIEVRRGMAGTRAWNSAPGECCHSTTGELGGLWRHRGKPPNQVAGIGFTAQGWGDPAPGYTRHPGSFDERAAFIFEGIAADETIGDFGLIYGGAAGDELDRIDHGLGTPHHTLLLASSSGHGPSINPVIEDFLQADSTLLGRDWPNVRADMVYFETPNRGAVFSVGSICWCASLSHNDYDNNVSRITQNVLDAFAHSDTLPPTPG